jgi:required for meiotic nuclear division protein 1
MIPMSFLGKCRHASARGSGRHLGALRTFINTSICLRTDIPKPKASTPLRKSAAASIPLREKPNASQGNIQSIFTLTTAERYNIQKLRKSLPEGAQLFQDAFWLPQWNAKNSEGEVFVFYSKGTIVCWGLSEEDAKQFAKTHITRPNAEFGTLQEPETEDLDFIKDSSEYVRLK